MEELLLRIKAIMRRSTTSSSENTKSIFNFGKYTFEYNRQMLSIDNKEQKLTSKEAELLKLLCENVNNVLDRTIALNKIWFDDSYFNARSMDVYVTKLRKYIKEDTNVELINVHGVGFKLVVS
jgi:DNA-binding response OmpR family regulator